MTDPLKKYIQDNRDDFDHLEPSAAVLFNLKKELKIAPKKEKKGTFSLWLVAASILITTSITYLLFTKDSKDQTNKQQFATTKLPKISTEQPLKEDEDKATKTVKIAHVKKIKKPGQSINLLAAYHDLTDSTSASTRLAAILTIQKSTVINYDIIDKLAKTLNHDSNSNVRMAALNLMSKYDQDSYVANAFMLSLTYQNDPTVQLGLIELLSHTNNPKLDDKLYALANDPNTFSAVKDQAYLVLLNQNKL